MSTAYLCEIRIMSFNYPPRLWAFCNGQTMSIQQNTALFSLLGTSFGGNGVTTFNLPDLRGNVPISFGKDFNNNEYVFGETGGTTNVTLTSTELPAHTHSVLAANADADTGPGGPGIHPDQTKALAKASTVSGGNTVPVNIYGTGASDSKSPFGAQAIGNIGGNLPHANQQPYLVLNFCIALQGIFPTRN